MKCDFSSNNDVIMINRCSDVSSIILSHWRKVILGLTVNLILTKQDFVVSYEYLKRFYATEKFLEQFLACYNF